jgi:hypothetical protein
VAFLNSKVLHNFSKQLFLQNPRSLSKHHKKQKENSFLSSVIMAQLLNKILSVITHVFSDAVISAGTICDAAMAGSTVT